MNLDLQSLKQAQQMLAYIQANNEIVCATYEYKNPLYPGIKMEYNKDLTSDKNLLEAVVTLFKSKMPKYNVENLLVTKLLENVLVILSNDEGKSETIKIPNGCCSMPGCPTKLFYECVLEIIRKDVEE